MAQRQKLSDILLNTERERLQSAWTTTEKADDFAPLPPGEYRCKITDGALFTAKSGTLGYKLTLAVLDGEHAGRKLWHDLWLSEAALPMAKRDLAKLGIEHLEQLEKPIPLGIILAAKVALRKGDDGSEFNRLTRFEVLAIEPPEADPFAPGEVSEPLEGDEPDTLDADGFDWAAGGAKGGPIA